MKKDNDGIPTKAWLRVAVFVLAIGGAVWFLSSRNNLSSPGEVIGEKVGEGSVAEGEVIGEATENGGSFIPEIVLDSVKTLGTKIVEVVPEETRESIKKTVEEKIIYRGQEIIESSQLVEEIKKTVNEATEEISGFPNKQKKDIKRQVIQQVCNELLEDLE